MARNLPWDHPENRFRKNIIREYPLFVLYVNDEKQGYLGRSLAWLKREGKVGFEDLNDDELLELGIIARHFRRSLVRGFGYDPSIDLINSCWLANHVNHGHHGHMHFIPRFRIRRKHPALRHVYGGERFGQNYPPDPPRPLSVVELEAIRKLIADNLPR